MSESTVKKILEKALDGKRISDSEGVVLFSSRELLELGATANELRNRRSDPAIVTYVVDRNINYTNVCVSECEFCAFHRRKGAPDAYVLDMETLEEKIRELVDAGGTQILIQGGLNPDLGIGFFERMFAHIKERFDVNIHGLSPPEVVFLSRQSGIGIPEVIRRLRNAGLDSIPGGGAEILADSVRSRVSPGKCSADEWIDVMRCAHEAGMRTTATMMFGLGESAEERVEHLSRVRSLQGETGGFTAFIPWTYQPGNTRLGGTAAGGYEYLMTLAVCRVYLDNFANIQASWVTQGKAVGTAALFFGANDMGGTMMEENVVAAAGCRNSMEEAALRRLIEEMGMKPVKRNTYYEFIENGSGARG